MVWIETPDVSAAVGIIAADFTRRGGFVLYTTFVFGFFINDSREFFCKRRFWLLTASLLGMHVRDGGRLGTA